MRRHGWGGDIPADDDEAKRRIVAAAQSLLEQNPARVPSISEVADRLSVTRQTVYRYFPSTQALLVESVRRGIDEFLDGIAAHLEGVVAPADAVVEGIAYTYEAIQRRSDLALLMTSRGGPAHEVTSPMSIELGRSILRRLPVDWAAGGYDDEGIAELVEMMLRTLQSFVVDPGDPPRSGEALRGYLRRWVGPAVAATATSPDR